MFHRKSIMICNSKKEQDFRNRSLIHGNRFSILLVDFESWKYSFKMKMKVDWWHFSFPDSNFAPVYQLKSIAFMWDTRLLLTYRFFVLLSCLPRNVQLFVDLLLQSLIASEVVSKVYLHIFAPLLHPFQSFLCLDTLPAFAFSLCICVSYLWG